MMKLKYAIIVRHGDYIKERGDKGTLTDVGVSAVKRTADIIMRKLKSIQINEIDLAIVSGAIRCFQSLAIVYERLSNGGITIEEVDISQRYFATSAEKSAWQSLYRLNRFSDAKEGEEKAIMNNTLASCLVEDCAERIYDRIRLDPKNPEMVLIVTHEPHGHVLSKFMSLINYEFLKPGEGRIIAL